MAVALPCFRQEHHPSATPQWGQVCRRCPAECPGVLRPARGSPWLRTGCPGSAWGSLPNREAFHLPLHYYLVPLPARPATHKPINPPTSPVSHSPTEPFTCLLPHFSTHKPCSHPQTYPATHQPIQPSASSLIQSHTQSRSPACYLTSLPTSPAATH